MSEVRINIMGEKLYVVGFAFNKKADHVVLVHKNRPEWQKGFINGVGGKVELDIDPTYADAMAREFREETGLYTVGPEWDHFATMHFGADKLGGEAMVFCFRLFTDSIFECKTQETEKIEVFELPGCDTFKGFKTLAGLKLIPHVSTLLPMARDKGFNFGDFKMQ